MSLFQSPQIYEGTGPSVFLAGSCGGDHWQTAAAERLESANVDVLNPRRPDYRKNDPAFLQEQTEWEQHHLEMATVRLFWFPADFPNAISLFELGRWATTSRPMVVGADVDYSHRQQIEAQLALMRPDIQLESELQTLADNAAALARSTEPDDKRITWSGQFINMAKRGRWEFADRVANIKGIVAMIAITDDRRLVLVEQERPPVNGPVIELPAGLAGDLADDPDEPLIDTARRELLEETGYEAKHWRHVFRGAPSAGTSSEIMDFYLATGLNKIGPGGGVGSENIKVHEVDLDDLSSWLEDQQSQRQVIIDAKIYAALPFAHSVNS
jgi:ADP-ribose pyrophosphatase